MKLLSKNAKQIKYFITLTIEDQSVLKTGDAKQPIDFNSLKNYFQQEISNNFRETISFKSLIVCQNQEGTWRELSSYRVLNSPQEKYAENRNQAIGDDNAMINDFLPKLCKKIPIQQSQEPFTIEKFLNL